MHTSETPQPRLQLTDARNGRGFSQQELADRIGTTHVNVSRWERGITKPSPYFRRKLSNLFGKTEEELDLLPPSGNSEQLVSNRTRTDAIVEAARQSGYADALYDPAIPLQPARGLIGREQDLATIKQRLFSGGNVSLTALNGLPGVGKTALSITLAHDPEVRAHFRDGILWAGLGPNPNMPGLLSRWGSLLGISATQMATLSNNEAWARAIRAAIGSRAMLLVIDDAWVLEEALTFKVGGPNCSHLVTTRFPTIASHMAVGGAMLIHELSMEQSIELLNMLAPQVVNREAQKVQDLVQAVGGLPLALTLMGNYLRKQAYSGPARRITAALERLSDAEERLQLNEPHAPVESHPSLPIESALSMHSIIAVTDQLLSPQARAALYALAVFPSKPNTFSEEAALAVAACTIDELDALTDAGLLESTGTDHDRYTLHQVIADYARMHLKEHNAHTQLIAYVTDYVEVHKKDYEMLELESGTILAALEVAHDLDKKKELVEVACTFAPFLILRGFYGQAEEHLNRAQIAAVALEDNSSLTVLLLYSSEVAQKRGYLTEAETYLQKGLELARQIEDKERICALLTNLGWVMQKRGDLAQAETYLQEGLGIARQIGNLESISNILKILGLVVSSQGDFVQAEIYLQEGLSIARQIGNREQICTLLINLGATAGPQGNYAQAEAYCYEGLQLARQIGHREQICVLLINLGGFAAEKGFYEQAHTYFQEGLELAHQIGHREWISVLLINLGMISQKSGSHVESEAYLKESLILARQIGRPRIICNSLYEYANLYLDQQKIDLAETSLREMLALIPRGDQELLALAYYGLARTLTAKGNVQEAQELGGESIKIFETIGHHRAEEVKHWLGTVKR